MSQNTEILHLLIEHHERLAGVCEDSAKRTRGSIAEMEADPSIRPDFAQGVKWAGVRDFNLRQAEWDEEKAAEHRGFAKTAKDAELAANAMEEALEKAIKDMNTLATKGAPMAAIFVPKMKDALDSYRALKPKGQQP